MHFVASDRRPDEARQVDEVRHYGDIDFQLVRAIGPGRFGIHSARVGPREAGDSRYDVAASLPITTVTGTVATP
jgi:hypothetical protein